MSFVPKFVMLALMNVKNMMTIYVKLVPKPVESALILAENAKPIFLWLEKKTQPQKALNLISTCQKQKVLFLLINSDKPLLIEGSK